MSKPERTPEHDAFQDEIDRLADNEDLNQIVTITHELIRTMLTGQLQQVRVELLLKEEIEIPQPETA